MRDILLIIIVGSILPFCIMRPYVGLLTWSWLGYMNPHRLTYGFAYNLPFVQIVALVTFIGLLFSKEPKRIPWTPVTMIWVLFIVWMTISTLDAFYPDQAWHEWMRMIKIQLMVLVTLMVINTRERINWLVWTIAISIGFYGIKGGIFTLLTGGTYRIWGPPGSFIVGNNEIAFALLIILPLMHYLQIISTNKWIKRAVVVAMILCGFAILGSYSRGALLGSASMIFALWLKGRNKLLRGSIILVVIITALSFMPDQWMERMDTIETYQQDGSAMGRINAWWFAYNLANENILTGGGYGSFSKELFFIYAPDPTDYHDAHSIYFEVLAEQGYIGLLLFVSIGLLTYLTGKWIIRNSKNNKELQWASDLAAMLQVSLIGYSVGGAFLGLAYFDLPYHIMAIMLLVQQQVRNTLLDQGVGVGKSIGNNNIY
jgi:putative inorganic carbon (HCO3(-)) transporter